MVTIYKTIIHEGPTLDIDIKCEGVAPDTQNVGFTATGNLWGNWLGLVEVAWSAYREHAVEPPIPATWSWDLRAQGMGLVEDSYVEGAVGGGYARFQASIPIVWMLVVDVPETDGPPSGYQQSGSPSRAISIIPCVDTREGATYSATTTAAGGGVTHTHTASGYTSNLADPSGPFAPFDKASMFMSYGRGLPGLYTRDATVSPPDVDDPDTIVWENIGDPIATLTGSGQVWGFGGLSYGMYGYSVHGDGDGVVIKTAGETYGDSYLSEWYGSSSVGCSPAYSITGKVYRGDSLDPATVVDYEDISRNVNPIQHIIGGPEFSYTLPSHIVSWFIPEYPYMYQNDVPEGCLHQQHADGQDSFWYQVVLADDGDGYANWPAAQHYDSSDRALFLRVPELLWEPVLTMQQATSHVVEPFTALGGWTTCSNCTSSIVGGALQIVTTGALASCANEAFLGVIRDRRFLRIRLKGPAGPLTFGMIIGGESKTWTITLASADTYEEHVLDLLRPTEGGWPGPCAPRHDAHSYGTPVPTPYTVRFFQLATGSTYTIDYIQEERSASGSHRGLARFRTPANWMWDRNGASESDVSYGRNLDVLSQGAGAPHHWFVSGTDPSREAHYGICAQQDILDPDPPGYAYATIHQYITDPTVGVGLGGTRPLIDMIAQGWSVSETDPGHSWFCDDPVGTFNWNDFCLACWIIEEWDVDLTESHTFTAAVQGEGWYLTCGCPIEIALSFVKFFGSQFEGAVVKATDGEGDRGSSGAVLQATCAAEGETSAAGTSDSVGAFLFPSSGVIDYGREYVITETGTSTELNAGIYGITRACVRLSAECDIPVPEGAVSSDIDRSADSRIYQVWSNGTTVSIRSTGGGTYNWTEYTVGAGAHPSVYQDDSRTDAAVFLAYDSGADVVLKKSVDSGASWTTIVSIFAGASCPHIRKDKSMNLCLGFAWKADGSSGNIVMRRSCDDWATFLEAEYEAITGVPEQTVALAFKGDAKHTYALSVVNGAGAVKIYESVDNGLTWAAI